MTITNEKRREVAARLRELANHVPADAEMVFDVLDLYEGECIDGFEPRCVERLADLIEPERVLTDMELANHEIMLMGDRVFISGFGHYTKERTCQNKAIDLSFKCSKCNCHVECGDYWASAYICDGDWNFCPNCGRKVVD